MRCLHTERPIRDSIIKTQRNEQSRGMKGECFMKERTGMNASRRRMVCKQLKNDWMLYALLLPVLLWYIIFCYLPMGGITLAFRNYRYDMGLWHSPWVGLLHFKTMFQDAEFWRAFSNTLIFSFGKLLFHFPIPIIVRSVILALKSFSRQCLRFRISSLGSCCRESLSICSLPMVSSINCLDRWDSSK